MTTTVLFDIEADGLRPKVVHCMSTINADTGERRSFRPGEIDAGVRYLETFDRVVAHNAIGYDVGVLTRLHALNLRREQVVDSLVLSHVLCGNIDEIDKDIYIQFKGQPGVIPGKLIGRHGIEAWGHRLHKYKGDYAAEMEAKGLNPWAEFSEEMLSYCEGDTEVLYELWTKILRPRLGAPVFDTHITVEIIGRDADGKPASSRATIPYRLPSNAYETNEPIFPASELIRAAKQPPLFNRRLTTIRQYRFVNVPGFLNSNIVGKKKNRCVEMSNNNDGLRPSPSTYIQRLTSVGAPKTYSIYISPIDVDDVDFVETTRSFHFLPMRRSLPDNVFHLEHEIAWDMEKLRDSGILFNVSAGKEMEKELQATAREITQRLSRAFPTTYSAVAKINKRTKLYNMELEADSIAYQLRVAALQQYKVIPKAFNVSSRKQVGELLVRHGYIPAAEDVTPSGKKAIDEAKARGERPPAVSQIKCSDDVLQKAVNFFDKHNPEFAAHVRDIRLFYLVQKRLGQLSSGAQAWLKLADKRGFIHPTINPCGAVTARATHSNPNVSQVPALLMVKYTDPVTGEKKEKVAWGVEGEWGADSRKLFIVPKGFKQVGADLAGIELRMLAHYLYEFDAGKFADIILTTDVHEANKNIIGFANRTDAKRFIFALMYGAGDEKLGAIIDPSASATMKKMIGRRFRDRIAANFKGFADLTRHIRAEASHGFITGLDGRALPVRAEHAALNTLLQSGGAIVAKVWIRHIRAALRARGLEYGYDKDYTFLLWSHDEVQFAVREGLETEFAQILVDAAASAGIELKCKMPIAAEAKIGENWYDTH